MEGVNSKRQRILTVTGVSKLLHPSSIGLSTWSFHAGSTVVLGAGLEPACLSAYAPQTYVSAIPPPERFWKLEDGRWETQSRKRFCRTKVWLKFFRVRVFAGAAVQ